MRYTAIPVLTFAAIMASIVSGCGEESRLGRNNTPTRSKERGAQAIPPAPWPRYTLRAEQTWQLNPPKRERFDASGLCLTATGELWAINDRGPNLYRVHFLPQTNSANLIEVSTCYTPAQLDRFSRGNVQRYDCEGVARDDQGRIYISEESNRWVLRCNPANGVIERLPIDWAPVKKYFDPGDPNASFEGIAVLGGRLYVANERQMGRIFAVDLEKMRVIDDFAVRPGNSNARDVHYSDLSAFDGTLYALLRESRCVLAIDPADHRVLGEYDFREMERDPQVLYRSLFPTGQMEGLAVERDFIWLVTDNNGTVRARAPTDIRPTLFKCRRADFRK